MQARCLPAQLLLIIVLFLCPYSHDFFCLVIEIQIINMNSNRPTKIYSI